LFLKLVLAQGSDCSCCLFKMFSRSHQPISLKNHCLYKLGLLYLHSISIVLGVKLLLWEISIAVRMSKISLLLS
jgi:hypothetical protein